MVPKFAELNGGSGLCSFGLSTFRYTQTHIKTHKSRQLNLAVKVFPDLCLFKQMLNTAGTVSTLKINVYLTSAILFLI